MVRIVTSFSPARIERQQHCMWTWLRYGCEVTAVQSVGEAHSLSPHFPKAEFIETDRVGDLFDMPHLVRISALTDLAVSEPVLMINSDIAIDSPEFLQKYADPPPNSLRLGIRYNVRRGIPKLEPFGIDAFLVTPELAKILPDIGMTMGLPYHDYLTPWFAYHNGIQITTDKNMCFYHEHHDRNWSTAHHSRGGELIEANFDITRADITHFIQVLTGRQRSRRRR